MTYVLLAASAFGAQALMFVPIVPLLVASGALAAAGRLQVVGALAALTTGIAAGDLLWYVIGRRRGRSVMSRLCRVALEPATCLRKAENVFGRYGASALLFARFVPGLSTVALPLAGVFRMQPRRFVLHDVAGVLLWVTTYVTAGYVTAGSVTGVIGGVPWSRPVWIAGGVFVLGIYLAIKHGRRRRLVRQYRTARIGVDELHRRMQERAAPVIVDLRHPMDVELDPYMVPGALAIPAEDLPTRQAEIPRDREVVVYCTCPDEITSARETVRLRRLGIAQVRPLQGGLAAWRAAQLPVERRGPVLPDSALTLNAA